VVKREEPKLTGQEFCSAVRSLILGTNEIYALEIGKLIPNAAYLNSRYDKTMKILRYFISDTSPDEIRNCFSSLASDEEVTKSYWGMKLLKNGLVILLTTTPKNQLSSFDSEFLAAIEKREGIPEGSLFEKVAILYLHSCATPSEQTIKGFLNSRGEKGQELILELPSLLKHFKETDLLAFLSSQLEENLEVLGKIPSAVFCNLPGSAGQIARNLSSINRRQYAKQLVETAQQEGVLLPDNMGKDIFLFLTKIKEDPQTWIVLFRGYLAKKEKEKEDEIIVFLLRITCEDLIKKLREENKNPDEIAEILIDTFLRILKKEKEALAEEAGAILAEATLEEGLSAKPQVPPPLPAPPIDDKKAVPMVPPPESKPEPPPESPKPPIAAGPSTERGPYPLSSKCCPECKKENPLKANFCAGCGSNFMKPPVAPEKPEPAPEPGKEELPKIENEAIRLARLSRSDPA